MKMNKTFITIILLLSASISVANTVSIEEDIKDCLNNRLTPIARNILFLDTLLAIDSLDIELADSAINELEVIEEKLIKIITEKVVNNSLDIKSTRYITIISILRENIQNLVRCKTEGCDNSEKRFEILKFSDRLRDLRNVLYLGSEFPKDW